MTANLFTTTNVIARLVSNCSEVAACSASLPFLVTALLSFSVTIVIGVATFNIRVSTMLRECLSTSKKAEPGISGECGSLSSTDKS